jgi:hypothetical protein
MAEDDNDHYDPDENEEAWREIEFEKAYQKKEPVREFVARLSYEYDFGDRTVDWFLARKLQRDKYFEEIEQKRKLWLTENRNTATHFDFI